MKLIKSIIVMVAAIAATVGYAGDSEPFRLDTRDDNLAHLNPFTMTWDASWIGGQSDATVVVADNGNEIKRTTGVGAFSYAPTGGGIHELSYTTYIGGVAQGEIYTARWHNQYTATFNANGGTGGTTKTQDYGSSLIAPAVTRTGCTFTGWLPSVPATMPAGSTTYTAQWEVNQYTVTFNANGGSGGTTKTQNYGTSLTAPTVTRTGYTFTGWSPSVPSTMPAGNTTYTAQWQINQYTVMFNANGGTVGTTSVSRTHGQTVGTLPTPTRTGYTFAGWWTAASGGTLISVSTTVSGNVTYYAHWTVNQYTVTFNANGGTGGWSKKLDRGSSIVAPTVTREWFDFAGWSPAVAATVPANDVTYTAQWQRYGDTISASKMGGKTMKQLYPSDYARMTTVVLEEGVRELPAGFFDGCDNVVNLTLPESLREFGIDDLPSKIRASLAYDVNGFKIYGNWILDYQDRGAAAVTIPNGVVGIGRDAFTSMSNLEAITFPRSLKSIASGAFKNCYFLDNVEIPDAVVSIGDWAFMNCTELQTLTLGGGLETVGVSAFENCISLPTVEFKDGLKSLGARAFAGPMRLMSVSLPSSLESIGESVFRGSEYITGVTAPSHLKKMSGLFPDSYEKLTSVVVPDGVTNVVYSFFAGCAALTDVTMPDSLVSIGASAFSDCVALAEIGLPNSVKTLGAGAFSYCTNLHTAALSKNLEAIQDRTFEKCPMLDSLVIPASVKSIGANIYSGADVLRGRSSRKFTASLTGVYFLGDAPAVDGAAYADMPDDMSSYVVKGSKGWYLAGSPTLPPGGWPTSNTRAITFWSPNRFSVTFDANGGQPATYDAEQITDTTYSLPKTNPTRNGYRFMGWWTEKTAGARITPNTRVTLAKEHTLYAHWQIVSDAMIVQFNPNGGTVQPDRMEYPIGATYENLPVPTRIGHGFIGWYTSRVGGILVTEASEVQKERNELYAHWSPITYLVRFHANGGTGTMADQSFTYNVQQALKTHAFSCTGFAFSGWAVTPNGQVRYAENAKVESLVETQGAVFDLYAVWSGARYSIRFDSNGGTGFMDNQTIGIGETQTLWPCAFTRAGYVFSGWATTPTGAVVYRDGASVKDLASVNGATVPLYAVWAEAEQTVRITFDANGGSVSERTRIVVGGSAVGTLPTPTRSGCVFAGWFTGASGGTQVSANTKVTSSVTYYAHWKRAYTVRYRKYDGSGETAEEDFECGKTYTLAWLGSELGWSRDGYEFVGWVPWNPDTKPRLCKYVNGQPVKDLAAAGETINLWAGWKSPSSYRVCFHLNDGTDVKMNQVILRNKEDDLAWMDSQIGWKCPGYSFRGWSEYEGSSTVKYANGATVMNLAMNGGTKHLYAVWELKPDAYVIQYHRYDGSGETREQEMNVGEEKNLLWMDSQLGWSRPGYEFIGWVPWNPDAKARLCKYVNGQKVEDIGEPGELVHLWAAWKSASSYRVCFNRNDGTGVKMNQVILRNKEDNLAWMDSMIGWKREGYVFKGWAETASGAVKYANGAKVKNLAMDGGTKHLYAIWRVAD